MNILNPGRAYVPPVVATLLLLAGCDGSDRVSPADIPVLQLSNELRIGSVDDPEYSLDWILALAVAPNGHIYTVHPETQVVREHDDSGRLVRTIGGEGEGPGEFLDPGPIGFLGDTLWVFDVGTFRVSYFDSRTGELFESVQAPVDPGSDPADTPPRPSGLLADGTMLARTVAWSHLVASGEITEVVWTRDGESIDTLAVQPVANRAWEVRSPDGTFRSYTRQPFADGPLIEWSPRIPELVRVEREASAASEAAPTFRVTKLTFGRETVFDRTYPFEPVLLTDARIDSVVGERAGRMAEQTNFAPGTLAGWGRATLYTPAHLPPVEALVVGMDGSAWLQLAADGRNGLKWLGLKADGEILGEVEAPREFRLLAATANRWWGALSDELDIPYIVRYDVGPAVPGLEIVDD